MNEPTKGRNTLPLQVLTIILIVVGLGTVLYLPKLLQNPPPHTHILPAAPGCDLHTESCQAVSGDQQVGLSIITDEISSAKPLLFEVEINNIDANQVMVDLQGKTMHMGINQTMLSKVPGTINRWQGEITLPICTTGRMTWVSAIKIEKNGQISQANFEFDAQ